MLNWLFIHLLATRWSTHYDRVAGKPIVLCNCKEGRWAQWRQSPPENFHTRPHAVRPRITPPFYTYPLATSVTLVSVSFFLVFSGRTPWDPKRGEEDVDRFD